VHFDGACQPPRGGGVATYGFTIEGEGLDYEESGLAVPPWSPRATNNVAEYTAAIRALEHLAGTGFRGQVLLIGDSELVVRQMQGEYEVRAEHLKAYRERLQQLATRFGDVRFVWVPREENARADALTQEALRRAEIDAARHRPSLRPAVPATEEPDASGPGASREPV
jgi:ribonuclease HI